MHTLWHSYYWKEGKPVGRERVIDSSQLTTYYRVVSDPYQKWISLERYDSGQFSEMVYDSRFLDFRKLKPSEQLGWRKEMINPHEAWIFNEDDRLILKESCRYFEGVCREIKIFSPFHHLLCLYQMPAGPEGDITLVDSQGKPVMKRLWDKTQERFTENWNLS